MKKLIVFYFLTLFLTTQTNADYIWFTNDTNQHKYALTLTSSMWEAAAQEAVSAGGHLVTINDADENQFLVDTFTGLVTNNYSIAWIGLVTIGGPMGDPASYEWVNNEPVEFLYLYNQYNNPHWYIHLGFLNNTWNSNAYHDVDDISRNCQGIIEVVPEPATLLLLGLGGLVLRRRNRN